MQGSSPVRQGETEKSRTSPDRVPPPHCSQRPRWRVFCATKLMRVEQQRTTVSTKVSVALAENLSRLAVLNVDWWC